MNSSCFHKEIHIDSFYSFREDKGETKIKLGRERRKKEKEGGREMFHLPGHCQIATMIRAAPSRS